MLVEWLGAHKLRLQRLAVGQLDAVAVGVLDRVPVHVRQQTLAAGGVVGGRATSETLLVEAQLTTLAGRVDVHHLLALAEVIVVRIAQLVADHVLEGPQSLRATIGMVWSVARGRHKITR